MIVGGSATALAQQGGAITGRVTGPDGNPIGSASVRMANGNLDAVTDRAGRYHITGVPAGQQHVIVRYIGFQSDTVPVTVTAGRTAALDVALELSSFVLDGIEVTGERGGQFKSMNSQRQSQTLINVVSADEIGSLPDQNVAEAVQRLSGVSIQTDRGEGRFVSIRGTAPNLNAVTLNGQTLASTAESRATALDLLPAAMVSNIEVTKAITPDMDGNSIGGTINIRTLTAFDRARPFLFGSIEGSSHDQQLDYGDDKLPAEASLTMGRLFGADQKWGVVLSGNASRRDFGASIAHPVRWRPKNDIFVPERWATVAEDNERERYGLSGNLDFRPSDRTSLYFRTYYSRTKETDDNAEFLYHLSGDLTEQTATTGKFARGSGNLDLALSSEDEDLYSYTLGGEHRFGALTWDGSGTFTRGMLDRFTRKTEFTTGNRNDFAASYNLNGSYFGMTPDNLGAVTDHSLYEFGEVDLEFESNRENTYTAGTNMRWDTRLNGLPAFLKTGVKFQQREKVIDDLERGYEGGTTPIDLSRYPVTPPGGFQGGSRLFVTGHTQSFYEFFRDNESNPAYFEFDDNETQLAGVENDSENRERVYAGYAMANVDIGKLSILGGVRLEHTRTESTRWQLLQNEDTDAQDVSSQTFENSYTNLLPAVILKYSANDNLILRAAWTNSIGRPDYEELAGFRSLQYQESPVAPGEFEGSISEGNPKLKPFEAMNLDLMAEYYVPSGGLLSVGGFYKRIDNPIYGFDFTETDVTVDGRFYTELRYRQDRNAKAGSIRGLEASYQQPLTFLPKPFDGLGITTNVAAIKSSVDVPGREADDLPFFGQSDLVVNVIPYFQRGPVELRLAWSYRSEYLRDIGSQTYEDRYWDARSTMDVTGRYTLFGDRMGIFGQVRNLTNEAEVGYQGVKSRYDFHSLTGRTFTMGLTANY
ncbi:MAG TPA: TonB-dependent receptor [Gemmatimonadaceae bacterium]|nr:TonB-dependent receptor [Gemmatimonadaceae bacterium]